ncbi:MAG: DNA methylase, partial [Desulfobacteraceae bacterium]|nr:DNA methylase [Desulfobacteraceae bacterium]
MKNERLTYLENLIDNNQRHFYATGKALNEIRDNRLYKLILFKTFEAYTKDRWDMGKSQAYRLIDAYQVVKNLSPIGEIFPANESQVRPLVSLPPFEQRKIWKDFLNTGMEKTAHNIKKFTAMFKAPDKAKPVDLTDQISSEYMAAVQAMLKQV